MRQLHYTTNKLFVIFFLSLNLRYVSMRLWKQCNVSTLFVYRKDRRTCLTLYSYKKKLFLNVALYVTVMHRNFWRYVNASSKYLMLRTNAISHYVSLCKIAFGCAHNMTILNFAQAMYVIHSPPWKYMLNRKYVICLNKYKILLPKYASNNKRNMSDCTNLSATNHSVCCQYLYEYFKSSHFETQ